jgi:hypothetical protein
MNTIDKITKDSRILVDSAKDVVNSNLVSSVNDNQLELTPKQLSDVLRIVELSFEDGYQRAIGTFQSMLRKHTDI